MSIWTEDGDMITRWRGNVEACEAAHGCWVDSMGNIYVAEWLIGGRFTKLGLS